MQITNYSGPDKVVTLQFMVITMNNKANLNIYSGLVDHTKYE